MLVTRQNFNKVLTDLLAINIIALDTETTGLRPHHGDRLFSIIMAVEDNAYYFNFQQYEGMDPDSVLTRHHLMALKPLFDDKTKLWILANAKFDMSMLAVEGLYLAGEIHCTQAQGRVIRNDKFLYSLASLAKEIGLQKDEAVEKYIIKNKLYTEFQKPGVKQKKKNLHFHKVPFEIIHPYGERDGIITYKLGIHQMKEIERLHNESKRMSPSMPTVLDVSRNEQRIVHTTFHMEQTGLRVDLPYCVRASQYETDRAEKAMAEFKRETGKPFANSAKLFETVFSSEKDKWEYTDPSDSFPNGQPSFSSDTLKRFDNPLAKVVLEYRDAKSKSDFYQGFIYHADSRGIVHPHLNSDGTATGRFSSSDPNFQNLTSEDEEEDLAKEFVIRRAIIPRPGNVFILPDYDQMEYRLMLDVAASILGMETELIKKVNGGLDVHEASRQLLLSIGIDHPRGIVKNGNFAILYGSGLDTLAWTIKGTREAARQLKEAIFKAAPEIKLLVNEVMKTAKIRGYVFNLLGRRSYFPDSNFAYKAPNYLIQGGCADIVKQAMNKIDSYLLPMMSRLILQVHDELVVEVSEKEISTVPKMIHEIMSTTYTHKFLPLTCSMEWSDKSMADKKKGFPV